MGKKQVNVSLRKPPPADPDAFVAGSDPQGGSITPRCEHASEGPTVVTRAGERREVTVYLPLSLARQLSVRCLELDRDVSSLVADCLVKTLSTDEAPPPIPLSAPPPAARWSRARELLAHVRARVPLAFSQT
jgi:hypothetical protein